MNREDFPCYLDYEPLDNLHPNIIFIGSFKHSKKQRKFVFKCTECEKDPELFGDGLFCSSKTTLLKGKCPCGCQKGFVKNENQWRVLLKRKAEKDGYKFLGFVEEYNPSMISHQLCILECPIHGQWESTSTASFLLKDTKCKNCFKDYVKELHSKPDEYMINTFSISGLYPNKYEFKRSEKLNNHGYRPYWVVNCKDCEEEHIVHYGSLQQGRKPCSCVDFVESNREEKDSTTYIFIAKDNGLPLFIKFGRSNNYLSRLKGQKAKTVYDLEVYGVWVYPSKYLSYRAENAAHTSVERQVVSKEEYKDGYSETTSVSNLDKIVSLYESYGGYKII